MTVTAGREESFSISILSSFTFLWYFCRKTFTILDLFVLFKELLVGGTIGVFGEKEVLDVGDLLIVCADQSVKIPFTLNDGRVAGEYSDGAIVEKRLGECVGRKNNEGEDHEEELRSRRGSAGS